MINSVGCPLRPESQLAFPNPLFKPLSWQTLRPRIVVRISCSSSSSPASPFPKSQKIAGSNSQRVSLEGEETNRAGSRGRSPKFTTRVASTSNRIPSEDSPESYFKKTQTGAAIKSGAATNRAQNGAASSNKSQNGAASPNRAPKVEVSARGKWQKQHESSLSEDEPLPLPMTWPDSEPASKEKIDALLSCNPEEQNCKSVIYQWTGDCKTCQGTGLVSFYRKRHEVISKCINCLGIGSVHNITSRADIEDMDGSKGSSNGSVRSNPESNGKA